MPLRKNIPIFVNSFRPGAFPERLSGFRREASRPQLRDEPKQAKKMMKRMFRIVAAISIVAAMGGCKAVNTLTDTKKSSQGKPYELIIACSQQEWTGPVGDSLRAVLAAPVPYLNQTEPLFDLLRVQERGLTGLVAEHRNILKIEVDPSIEKAAAGVEYDVTARPQIIVTMMAPSDSALTRYISENRKSIVEVLEQAERDRSIQTNSEFYNTGIDAAVRKTFGVGMKVPKGYTLAKQEADFIWARYEYPTASQGFFVYSYPYEGPEALKPEALIAARNRFAARIPGPSDGSYMTTSDAFPPAFRMFRLEGRLWCELRGFWDVAGDFMGGPFVSYTTVDTKTNRVFTLDGYVYSPKLHKRNFVRGVEHLLYTVHFPDSEKAE